MAPSCATWLSLNTQISSSEALAQPIPANGPGDPGVGRATSVDLMGICPGPGG
jgi:hypothetical protein